MNSFLKTLLTAGVATLGPALDTALQNPTGGSAAYLSAHPQIAIFYGILALGVHNWLSQHNPPPAPPAAPVVPPKA